MSAAALDRLLAILLAAILASGLLTLRAGSPATSSLFVLHGILACSLAVAVGMKVARSLPRAVRAGRWRAVAVSLALGMAVATSIVAGFAWVVTGHLLAIGPWTVLTFHVLAGLAAAPIVVAHLLPRRWRVLRPPTSAARGTPISRRTAIGTVALAVAGAAAWLTANAIERATGGTRRFTGSRWLSDGGIPPATTFFGEQGPSLDTETWRLRVDGAVARPLSLSLGELAALGSEERLETLDCTSGWALRTLWRGTPLSTLLAEARPEPAAHHVTVRAATGWYARLSLGEADGALLATEVAGRPLPPENGAPCRLVIRDRRGLEWVKWVSSVTVA
jgi:DMSO/TMAO reductase YedYZ molybdopterin-dependent catalytic subunit